MIARRFKNDGFGAVELLVVIAILGILVALLLPAIQAAREAARRTQCLNNCRQLILAALNHESAKMVFPPAGLVAEAAARPDGEPGLFDPMTGPQFSWISQVLPFMEEQALYDGYDFSQSIFDQPAERLAVHVATLICPSNRGGPHSFKSKYSQAKTFAKGNYAGFVSPVHLAHEELIPGALGGFRPGKKNGQKISRIKDGLSRTLMIAEVQSGSDPADQRGAWMLPWSGSSLLSANVPPKRGLGDFSRYDADDSQKAKSGAHTPNSSSPDVITVCSEQVTMPCVAFDSRAGGFWSSAPRSLHPRGVNATLTDGAALFLSSQIDAVTFAYLVCANDGKSVDVP